MKYADILCQGNLGIPTPRAEILVGMQLDCDWDYLLQLGIYLGIPVWFQVEI